MSNNDLSQFSDAELQQELEKRSQSKNQRPQPIEVDAEEAIAKPKKNLDQMIDQAIEEDYWDSDYKHYLYEVYCETFYGREFWDWKRDIPG
jgi:hypothetical protein